MDDWSVLKKKERKLIIDSRSLSNMLFNDFDYVADDQHREENDQ